jgi:hypothetical protein
MQVFIVEMIMKWIGVGIKSYFKDRENTFDFVIIILYLIECILIIQEYFIRISKKDGVLRET